MHMLLFALASFLPQGAALAPDTPVVPFEEQMRVARAHYETAAEELELADVTGLTPDQRVERERLIGVLRAYSARSEYAINALFPGARVPLFIDPEGRRCAVAELLYARGEKAFVESVHDCEN